VERTVEVDDADAPDIDPAGEVVGVERLGVRLDAERHTGMAKCGHGTRP
jgi:hypothetical protein